MATEPDPRIRPAHGRGRYGYQPKLPVSPGIEGVGIVEAVGPGVQGLTALPEILAPRSPATSLPLEPCLCMRLFPVFGRRTSEIRHAALRSPFDLFDIDDWRLVASPLGAFPAARQSASSDERPSHHVVERSPYAVIDCAVSMEELPRSNTDGRWVGRTGKSVAGFLRKGAITSGASWRSSQTKL